jgi:hypothetical protein
MLDREEYVEQAYFFRALGERMNQNMATQDLLVALKDELLTTTKLPLALDYLSSELKLRGVFHTAMAKIGHYFTPFQTFVIAQAEAERGRFDFNAAMEILHREAAYKAAGATAQGMFLYQFETLCRNRLRYDHGLDAMAGDPLYNDDWRDWLKTVRVQIGFADIADMIYVRSQYYLLQQRRAGRGDEPEKPVLFGEKEGKIALANRKRDPLLLFAALQRHLGYPEVARAKKADETPQVIPMLLQRVNRLETRIKLLEEEQRSGGIDLSRFFRPPAPESGEG